MNAEVNVNIVFILAKLPDSRRFMQNNYPKHTSRLAKAYLEEQDIINWWHTPAASSVDINPIQCVWAELKQYIARRIKPLTKSELVKGIVPFGPGGWPRKSASNINHKQKVLPKVEAKKSCITGE